MWFITHTERQDDGISINNLHGPFESRESAIEGILSEFRKNLERRVTEDGGYGTNYRGFSRFQDVVFFFKVTEPDGITHHE